MLAVSIDVRKRSTCMKSYERIAAKWYVLVLMEAEPSMMDDYDDGS